MTSSIQVSLTSQSANIAWGEKARISFDGENAHIHCDPQSLVDIQKAARQLESIGISSVSLTGEGWDDANQLAFAKGFCTASRQNTIAWAADSKLLQVRHKTMLWVRDLINQPPSMIFPQSLTQIIEDFLCSLSDKVSCKKLVGDELAAAGWVGIYNVGRGSDNPPVLLEVDYNPTGDENAPIETALVGKGITFDSGGYSLKATESMLTMKCDMGGAATVAGALAQAIMLGLNKRVKMFLCCAENLVSGHAYKLGDILTYKNGVSVEVVNTDAEGRLVLADGLIAASACNPKLIIDAATLTGAALVAVGTEYNAVFSMNPELAQHAVGVAKSVNEPAWHLPLEKFHQDNCPSPYATTANSRPQKGGGFGGASNAAGFLSRFVAGKEMNWLHFDLAAVFNNSATGMWPAGASGQGVSSICQLILEDN